MIFAAFWGLYKSIFVNLINFHINYLENVKPFSNFVGKT